MAQSTDGGKTPPTDGTGIKQAGRLSLAVAFSNRRAELGAAVDALERAILEGGEPTEAEIARFYARLEELEELGLEVFGAGARRRRG